MRDIDNRDRAVALDLAPPPDTGDPLPVVLAKDGAVIPSYVAGRELTVMATFPGGSAHVFGGPDAKSIKEHPLAERGLKAHGAYEVRDSVFECVANDIGVELIREDDDTIKLMSKRLYK